jgi:DNA repair exonuclease SbcCD ATPase subunit
MRDTSMSESLTEKKCPLCGRGLTTEEQKFIRDRYSTEFAAIQERLEEEAGEDSTQQS